MKTMTMKQLLVILTVLFEDDRMPNSQRLCAAAQLMNRVLAADAAAAAAEAAGAGLVFSAVGEK
jgi:hypothetical protein